MRTEYHVQSCHFICGADKIRNHQSRTISGVAAVTEEHYNRASTVSAATAYARIIAGFRAG